MNWCANKVKQVLVIVVVLHTGTALLPNVYPFKIHKISKDMLYDGPQPRIFGGLEAPEEKFPFMIFVLMKHGDLGANQCSASLIKPDWVLLAAHCVSFPGLGPENIITVGGRADLAPYIRERINTDFYKPIDEKYFGVQERRVLRFFRHPEYDTQSYVHDMALIKVKKPFILDGISLIPLSDSKMTQPMTCTILGWGLTAENKQNFRLHYAEHKWVVTTEMGCKNKKSGPFICLLPDGRKICQGDSGSPLVCNNKVWGVASHFVSYSQNPDCGDSLEEYYGEVHADLDWIRSVYNSGNYNNVISVKTVLLSVFFGVLFSSKM